MDKLLYYVGIPVLINIIPQLLINVAFSFLLKEKHLKTYRTISYIFITLWAISVPVRHMIKTHYAMSVAGTIDPAAFAINGYTIFYWIFNAILMILIQVLFNQVYLPKQLKHSEKYD